MYRQVLVFFLVLMIEVIPHEPVMAGDEDMMSPYTQFDPETGFFLPIDPQAMDQQPLVQDTSTTGITSTPASPEPPSQMVQEESVPISNSSQNEFLFITGGLLLIIAGTVLAVRRTRNKVSQ